MLLFPSQIKKAKIATVTAILASLFLVYISPSANAEQSTILGTTGANPIGITIDSSGNIYTANGGANNVSKITPLGVSTILGTTGRGPIGITIDSSGNIYTANSVANNVSKITPLGVSTILGTTGDAPRGITIDSSGNIYTANTNASNVSKITVFNQAAANTEAARAAEAARVAAAAEAARKAKEQRELTEILALIPKIGELTLSLGETTKALYSTKCVKGKTIKYVNKGIKCPKGYVKKK